MNNNNPPFAIGMKVKANRTIAITGLIKDEDYIIESLIRFPCGHLGINIGHFLPSSFSAVTCCENELENDGYMYYSPNCFYSIQDQYNDIREQLASEMIHTDEKPDIKKIVEPQTN